MPTTTSMRVVLTEHAQAALSSLGDEDRRRVGGWLDHLRNWNSDDFVRSRSRRLASEDDTFVFRGDSELLLAFKIQDDDVVVLSLFRKDALQPFEARVAHEA